jgi:hypothetical protein
VCSVCMTDDELKARYLATGLSFRKLGAELGRSEFHVRYRLRRLPKHHSVVTRVMINRVTHARGRARKHALAMLRQKRPALYLELIERTRPLTCQDCARAIQARATATWWRWKCAWCGTTGRVPLLV